MNALNNAMNDLINYEIPKDVLEIAFPDNGFNISLEERIISKCVRPVILRDLNLVSGNSVYVMLKDCEIKATRNADNIYSAATEFIVKVPKELTNDKSIISVSNMILAPLTSVRSKPCMPDTMRSILKLNDSTSYEKLVQTSKMEVVGENLIFISGIPDWYRVASQGYLSLTVENNENLENIQPMYYRDVSKVIVSGVKRYIYNKLAVEIDKGYIYAGHELGLIKEFIDSYRDEKENYEELIQNWSAISLMNDRVFMDGYIRSMIGSRL